MMDDGGGGPLAYREEPGGGWGARAGLQNQQGSCRPACPAQAHSWVPPLQSQPSQGLGRWEAGKDKDRYLMLEQRPGLGVPA